jgi:predicted RNA-binding Zn-ribbon protein involved in translation (DUF1610 family)
MELHRALLNRALPLGVAIAVPGATLIVVGAYYLGWAYGPLLLSAGVVLVGLAVAGVLWSVAVSARRSSARPKTSPYACPKCSYVAKPSEIEDGQAFPCPICGQPMYDE